MPSSASSRRADPVLLFRVVSGLVTAGVIACVSSGCDPGGCAGGLSGTTPVISTPPVATAKRPDVVMITLDTLRADHLGAYGHAGAVTDTLDALAAKGVRYTRAYSPLPLTIPAHSTMFTGLFPFHHGVRSNGDNTLAPSFVTLAEHLEAAGYATGASVAAFVTTRQWGFNQGFDAYYDYLPEGEGKNYWHTERSGDAVVDDALGWLSEQPSDRPAFLWVHLYDAHFPYQAHPNQPPELASRPYDAEIAFLDDQVGRLVEAFSGRDPLWVIVGDHGEGLGEHNEPTHGLFNYDATQHVPWIISGAGVTPGVVETPVSTADVMPTVLNALGLAVPEGLDGRPAPSKEGRVYAESYQLSDRFRLAPHRMIVEGEYKLIATPDPELYDLLADPGERNNLAGAKPEVVQKMLATLGSLGATPPGKSSSMDADTISQLAALGYMGGGGGDVDYDSLPDPKSYLDLFQGLAKIEAGAYANAPNLLLEAFQKLSARKPDAMELRTRQVPLLARAGRPEEARLLMEETAALFPAEARVWVMLSGMASRDNDAAGALTYARKAIEAAPADKAAQEVLVSALFENELVEEGLKSGTDFLAANPKNPGLAAVLGRYYLGTRNFVEAERHLRMAVDAPDPRRGARWQLAWLAYGAGYRDDAVKLLEEELKDYPVNVKARRLMAQILGKEQAWGEQLPHLQAVARLLPNDARAQEELAQCLFNLGRYEDARDALDLALRLAPEDPTVLLLHANLLAKEGRREEGQAVFERAKLLKEQLQAERTKQAEAAREVAKKEGKGKAPAAPVKPAGTVGELPKGP